MEEIFKDIPSYEGSYQVSNQGNVRSLDRIVKDWLDQTKRAKGKVLKGHVNSTGYLSVRLSKYRQGDKDFYIHQLVAMAFLGHIPCGNEVKVRHINGIRNDNRPCNLELVKRSKYYKKEKKKVIEDPSKKKSKYPKNQGIHWSKSRKKWVVKHNGKYLKYFEKEKDANQYYEEFIIAFKEAKRSKKSSKFRGIYWNKSSKKWMVVAKVDGKSKTIGYFEKEEDASDSYQQTINNDPKVIESIYKGVTWEKRSRRWKTRIGGKFLGYFEKEEDASDCYQEALISSP